MPANTQKTTPGRRGGTIDILIKIIDELNRYVHFEQLLSGIIQDFIEYVDCDAVRLVFRDGGRSYYCEMDSESTSSYNIQSGWAEDGNDLFQGPRINRQMERLLQDILDNRFDEKVILLSKIKNRWKSDCKAVATEEVESPVSQDTKGIRLGPDSCETVLLPVVLNRKTVGVLQLESKIAGRFEHDKFRDYEYLVDIFGIAWNQWCLKINLRERVKEQTCLYSIARLVAHPQWTLNNVVREAVEILPPGWLYPEIAVARIVIDDSKFESTNFINRVQSQQSDILVDGIKRGYVEVAYVEEKPRLDEGPFLAEERKLIDAIAGELSFIIKQKEDREKNQELQTQLQYANQMAILGQFAAGMAHELNDPLGSILGFAQLILKNREIPTQIKQDVDKIIAAALKSRDIMKKLDIFTGSESATRTRFDLNEVIEDAFQSLKPRFQKTDIELVCDYSDDLPVVYADRSQVIQALIHLVVNAVQAMTEGGKLIIRTSAEPGTVIITVEDTGVGIPAEIRDNLFNPFFTTKDVNEGKGLGLSIVHGIVKSHGGTIQSESELGKGTRFVIKLPVRK